MRRIFNSLAVKVGLAIVMAEIIVLSVLGTYYVGHLNAEIDNAAASRLKAVGTMLQEAHLKYASVADRAVMTELVGEELEDGMVIGATGNVFHSLEPAHLGRAVSEIEHLDSNWFKSSQVEQQIIALEDSAGSHLIGVTPLFTFDSNKPFLFAYVRVNTETSTLQKAEVRNRVLYGSLICVVLTSLIIFISFNKLILRRILRTAGFCPAGSGMVISAPACARSVLTSWAGWRGRSTIWRLSWHARNRSVTWPMPGFVKPMRPWKNRVNERTKQLREAIDQLEREVEGHKLTGRGLPAPELHCAPVAADHGGGQ